jgi:citrate lyase beta subunit
MLRSRRALLYVPGDDLHKIEKAAGLGADCVCLDIEDGVAANRKADARDTIAQALQTINFGRSERLVRINPVNSGLEVEDLNKVIPAHPDGIVLPKVQNAEQVKWVSAWLLGAEKTNGWLEGSISLIVLIESALGVVNLREIAGADPRLQALIFGAEDLAGDIGAVRTRPVGEIFYARSAVANHAAAFGLQAIDMVWMDLHDLEGLRAECRQGAQMAYSGKQVIHPNQVEPAHTAFAPSDEAIAQARRIVAAAAQEQDAGKGAFALDGKMVDMPVVKTAEWVLARARAAGKIE